MSTAMTTTQGGQQLERVGDQPTMAPLCDIYENNDEYLIVADVPGASDDGLKINLEAERLTIRADVEPERYDSALEQEFGWANYERSFAIPDAIDRDKVSADLNAGVLRVHLPKSDAVRPRRIEVKSG